MPQVWYAILDEDDAVVTTGDCDGISDNPFIAAGYVHSKHGGPGLTTLLWTQPVELRTVFGVLAAETPPPAARVSGGGR
jgi:hypothetical protein